MYTVGGVIGVVDESVDDGRLADVLVAQQHDLVLRLNGIHPHMIQLMKL